MWSSPGAQRASRERTIRYLLERQEQARASAYEWSGRAGRYVVAAIALFGLNLWLGWWPLFVLSILAGLGALLSWEKAARDRLEGSFDLATIIAPDEDLGEPY